MILPAQHVNFLREVDVASICLLEVFQIMQYAVRFARVEFSDEEDSDSDGSDIEDVPIVVPKRKKKKMKKKKRKVSNGQSEDGRPIRKKRKLVKIPKMKPSRGKKRPPPPPPRRPPPRPPKVSDIPTKPLPKLD